MNRDIAFDQQFGTIAVEFIVGADLTKRIDHVTGRCPSAGERNRVFSVSLNNESVVAERAARRERDTGSDDQILGEIVAIRAKIEDLYIIQHGTEGSGEIDRPVDRVELDRIDAGTTVGDLNVAIVEDQRVIVVLTQQCVAAAAEEPVIAATA